MMYKILQTVLSSIILALLLLLLGAAISFFIDSTQGSLSTVLFILGGIVIAIFSPGLFRSSSSGALHTPVVVYRLVNTLSRKGHREKSEAGTISYFFSSLSLVIAGAILWGVSYFV